MKNIHLIPTEKYSDLVYSTNKYGGLFLSRHYSPMKNMGDSYQNIYITSDEEIKEGDYVCASGGFRFVKTLNNDRCRTFTDDGIVSKQNPLSSCHLSNYKKIILTTDTDLIKDGVQAIDDEFLEWFVKNQSCEEVEIVIMNGGYDSPKDVPYQEYYKMLIPKEEPKQETLEEVAHKMLDDYGIKSSQSIGVLEVKKLMVKMAKWQAERMYSKEDILDAWELGAYSGLPLTREKKEKLFEQFKNNKC